MTSPTATPSTQTPSTQTPSTATPLGTAVTPGSSSTTGTWALGDAVLLRIAGAAASGAHRLRFPRTAAWATSVLASEAACATVAEELRDHLTARVADLAPDDLARPALINLRRDAFNGRMPRPATVRAAQPALTPSGRLLLDEWVAARAALAERTADGEAILGAELPGIREEARALIGSDGLRCAVLLQSDVLERQMDRWLTATRLDKHARQAERTLLEMAYRATMKTSPFSTLTSVALAQLGVDGDHALPVLSPAPRRHLVRLNVAVLARLAAAIAARPDLRADFVVTLAPGARLEEDLVRYSRRRTAQSGDSEAVVAIDSVHESLFFLPSGPALADVAAAVSRARLTVADAAVLVQFSATEPRSPEDVDALLGHLLRLGLLLLPELQLDLHADDPSAAFVAILERQRHPVLAEVARHLAAARAGVERYARTRAPDRHRVLTAIRADLDAAARAVGAPGLVPRTVIYEDTFSALATGDLDRSAWSARFLPDLTRLAAILPAFDANLPRRLTALGFFRARYGVGGSCHDFERFCHEFQRDFFDPYTKRLMRRRAFSEDNTFQPQENWFHLPQIEAVDAARERASQVLGALAAQAPPEAEEIRLDNLLVDAVNERLGAHAAFAIPWSFFAQITGDPRADGTRLVLNQAYAGLTVMFSRFAHGLRAGDPEAQESLRRVLREAAPPDAVVAELRGGYDTTNLNVHPVVTDYEIVCPGDVSTRPAAEQIGLDELVILHDSDTDTLRLWSTRLRTHVVPVYLGFLMPMALPEIQQVLLCFSPSGMAQLDLWAGTGVPVPPDRVSTYPRLTIGSIVLQRRMWKVPVTLIPQRTPGQSDAAHFLAVNRWRRAHGIPDRVFAQVDFTAAAAPPDDGDEGSDGAGRPKASRKPLSVDFDSWFSVALLEHLVASAESRLVLTEALPSEDELWLRDDAGEAHVSELLIELYPKGMRT